MWSAEGRSPFARCLRVSLRHNFFPLPGQEEAQGDARKGFFSNLRAFQCDARQRVWG